MTQLTTMEKQPEPEKFPRMIRRDLLDIVKGWEDGGGHQEDAYHSFINVLKRNGITLDQNTKVLELASGDSKFLDNLRSHDVNAIGVDVRPRGRNKSPQVIARIEQLPFPDESFEVIISSSVFDAQVYDQNQKLMTEEI